MLLTRPLFIQFARVVNGKEEFTAPEASLVAAQRVIDLRRPSPKKVYSLRRCLRLRLAKVPDRAAQTS
jgi:hypothetical protein